MKERVEPGTAQANRRRRHLPRPPPSPAGWAKPRCMSLEVPAKICAAEPAAGTSEEVSAIEAISA